LSDLAALSDIVATGEILSVSKSDIEQGSLGGVDFAKKACARARIKPSARGLDRNRAQCLEKKSLARCSLLMGSSIASRVEFALERFDIEKLEKCPA